MVRLRLVKIFSPILPGATLKDRLVGCLGALIGIALTGLLGLSFLGDPGGLPFLVAPLGASAVLLFAVPSSPLAQPWSIIGGNTIGALVGAGVASAVPDTLFASALAVPLAIAAMSLCRCLHPPGGAAALVTVLGGPSVIASGYAFAFVPVGANSVALVALGLLFHQFSSHRYPHRRARVEANIHRTNDAPPMMRLGFDEQDIDAAIEASGEAFDISRNDLDALLRAIELRSLERRSGYPTCGEVMSRDLVVVSADASLKEARNLMLHHAIRTLPVVNAARQLLGIVTLRELAGRDPVRNAMVEPLVAKATDSALALAPRLSDGRHHAVVVINDDREVIGMITQTDLLATLVRQPLAAPVRQPLAA